MKTPAMIAALMLAACGAPTRATQASDTSAPTIETTSIFTNAAGVAIGGFDPVQYFIDGAALEGDPAYATDHGGARFYFTSAENKAKFDADPAAFTPQYGGYCAFGLSRGYKAPTQADTGQVVDGKLYFNYNKDVQKTFDKDRPGFIAKADANWPSVKDAPPKG
jgi:YHS domain-containing protein